MAKKEAAAVHTADEVRQTILSCLAENRQKARGLSALRMSSRDIKKAMRAKGITQNETVTNLDYLLHHGWVEEQVTRRPFTTPGGFEVPNEKRLYGLSDLGLKHTEDASSFSRTGVFSGISITNIGGVTVVGDGNIVRNEFVDVLRALTQLEGVLKLSEELTENQKLDAQAEIQTIKSQLSKSTPDKGILKKAMDSIAFVGSLPGVAEAFKTALEMVQKIGGQ